MYICQHFRRIWRPGVYSSARVRMSAGHHPRNPAVRYSRSRNSNLRAETQPERFGSGRLGLHYFEHTGCAASSGNREASNTKSRRCVRQIAREHSGISSKNPYLLRRMPESQSAHVRVKLDATGGSTCTLSAAQSVNPKMSAGRFRKALSRLSSKILGFFPLRCNDCDERWTQPIWDLLNVIYARCPQLLRSGIQSLATALLSPAAGGGSF